MAQQRDTDELRRAYPHLVKALDEMNDAYSDVSAVASVALLAGVLLVAFMLLVAR